MNRKEPWYLSNTTIILSFIFFFYLGPFGPGPILLYLRWLRKNGKYSASMKTLFIFAILLFFLGFCCFIAFVDSQDTESLWIAIVLFFVPALLCASAGFKKKAVLRGYKKYIDYINARDEVKIDSLCNNLQVNKSEAVAALTDIINKDIIKGYLTETEFKFPESNSFLNFNRSTSAVAPVVEEEKELKIVRCQECGAKNTVVEGEIKKCEYCGSLLQ